MFTRDDANPDHFISQAEIPDWSRPILSKSIVLLHEQKADTAFEKLIEQVVEAGESE